MLKCGTTLLLATFIASAAATDASAAQQDAPPPSGRLPDSAVPQAYRIDLTIAPEKARFLGHVEIDVSVNNASSSLWINGKNLHVVSAVAKVGGKVIRANYSQVAPLGTARLDFERPVPAGPVTLSFDYDAPFAEGPAGLFRLQVGGKWHVWSQFEAINARNAFPGFDQPGYKTPFTITITAPPGDLAASNAPELRVIKTRDGMERHVFATTKPLPTYLTAFVTGPFATLAAEVSPTAQRLSALPSRIIAPAFDQARMRFALDATASIVRNLEDYFARPFPYPKLDQIASPGFPGAMENAGAVIYNDEEFLLGADAGIGQLNEFGTNVSHELSHQWFGDLVTPDWWSDIWLNESFADWMGLRIANRWRPDLKLGTTAINQAFAAMNLDALTAGRAIHQPIATDGEIISAFDPITYNKGGQVIAMIAAYMGDDRFREGVRLHIARHADGTATTDQFFQSLSDVAHDPRIAASLRSFVDQQGVPLVSIRRDGNNLILAQSPYAPLGVTPAPRSWVIPVCYAIGDKRDCVLMDKAQMTIPAVGTGPIMPNAGGNGYYRFSLDDESWKLLLTKTATLPEGEALAVTDSLWASFAAGKAPAALLVSEARSVLDNLGSSAATDPGGRFRTLVKHGLIERQDLPAYRKMLQDLYASKLKAIGFDPTAGAYNGETADRQTFRAQLVRLIGLDAEDPTVRGRLADAATAWMAGNKDALDQTEMPNAFAAYVSVGGLPAVRTMIERALTGDDSYFRAVVMDAAARSGDAATGKWLLALLDDPRVRASERTRAVRLLMEEPATRDLGYAAMLTRFDELAKGGFGGAASVMTMPSNFCSVEAAARIERDLRPKAASLGTGAVDLDRTVERVRTCGALKAAKGQELADAVRSGAGDTLDADQLAGVTNDRRKDIPSDGA